MANGNDTRTQNGERDGRTQAQFQPKFWVNRMAGCIVVMMNPQMATILAKGLSEIDQGEMLPQEHALMLQLRKYSEPLPVTNGSIPA